MRPGRPCPWDLWTAAALERPAGVVVGDVVRVVRGTAGGAPWGEATLMAKIPSFVWVPGGNAGEVEALVLGGGWLWVRLAPNRPVGLGAHPGGASFREFGLDGATVVGRICLE